MVSLDDSTSRQVNWHKRFSALRPAAEAERKPFFEGSSCSVNAHFTIAFPYDNWLRCPETPFDSSLHQAISIAVYFRRLQPKWKLP